MPLVGKSREDLEEDGHQGKGCGTFGNHAQISRHHSGSTLISIGRPEVERHERYFESQSAEEERQARDHERCGLERLRHIAEIERTAVGIEEGESEEHHAARERCGEDVLGSALGRVVAVAVESHETCHGNGSHFESEVEHEEMSRRHHDEHTEQGRHHEHVELSLLSAVLVARDPLAAHDAHHE